MLERAATTRLFESLLERPFPVAGTLAVLLALVETALDWTTWVELDVSTVYGLPLVLAAVARNRRLLWGLTALLVSMTFAAYATQIGPQAFSPYEPYFINRILSAVTLVLTACLCQIWIVAANRLASQRRALIEQNQELARLRASAQEASSRKTRLLASVSHDIRTPLTTIDLIADLISRSAHSPALAKQLPDLVQRLRRNTRSLADLVTALVDMSALDTGRIGVNPSEFSLNELLWEECKRLEPLAEAKRLSLIVDPPQPPILLRTDRVKLTRVLGNLIGNGIKFTQAGGITVAAALQRDGSVSMHVTDTGVGMAPEELDRIFEEYGQLGTPFRDSQKGWGLGLAICRRLVGVMGGEIRVESEPGRGTTFSVHLPASCVVSGARLHSLRLHRH